MSPVKKFLQDNGGRYCLSVPGRENAVKALADAAAARNEPVREREAGMEIRRMIADGVLQLEEEHHSGGAFWAFTLKK